MKESHTQAQFVLCLFGMHIRVELLLLGLAILIILVQEIKSDDDVKKKRVIIKIPRRIKHIYHHHTKKIHVHKPQPKPVVHVVEEVDPLGKAWAALNLKYRAPRTYRQKGRPAKDWGSESLEQEYDFDNEEQYSETEEEDYGTYGRAEKREPAREAWTSKRNRGYSWELDQEDSRKQQSKQREHRSQIGERGRKHKKSQGQRAKPRRPIDKGLTNYDEYVEVGGKETAWPEKKEHISWHLNQNHNRNPYVVPQPQNNPQETNSWSKPNVSPAHDAGNPSFGPQTQNIPFEINGWPNPSITPNVSPADDAGNPSYGPQTQNIPFEINGWPNPSITPIYSLAIQSVPDIPIVPAPKLHLQQPLQQFLIQQHSQPQLISTNQQQRNNKQNDNSVPKESHTPIQTSETKNVQVTKVRPQRGRSHKEQRNKLSYSSHIGHSDNGGATSFQFVQFGNTTLPNADQKKKSLRM